MRLSVEDHAIVTAAVALAEAGTAGEIVTMVARRSDRYREVPAHAGVLAMLAVLAVLATWPGIAERAALLFHDPWAGPPPASALFLVALVASAIAFLLARYLVAIPRVLLMVTPATTKARRVRARALDLFRASAEKKTAGETGVLLYLSLDEHRAELIADAAIHSKVPADVWGHAMASLVDAVRDGRIADGLVAAVGEVGIVLAEHFPRAHDDVNELPDRLIEL